MLFLAVLGLFVLFANIAHFHKCEENSCVTPFILGFNIFWLIVFIIIFDMYRKSWENYSSQIKLKGLYWFGWVMELLVPYMLYSYSWLPLVRDGYDYRETMLGYGGQPSGIGIELQYLGEKVGMWLPSLTCLLISLVVMWTGSLLIKRKHPFNVPNKAVEFARKNRWLGPH
jgi:hypothetical protein